MAKVKNKIKFDHRSPKPSPLRPPYFIFVHKKKKKSVLCVVYLCVQYDDDDDDEDDDDKAVFVFYSVFPFLIYVTLSHVCVFKLLLLHVDLPLSLFSFFSSL